MKTPILFSVLVLILAMLNPGCAAEPKPKTIGGKIGQGIDNAIAWTGKGLRKLVNDSDRHK